MSYRDNRNLIEMLRALGYPNLVSTESFRTPNFALVADLLVWLSKRFDPDIDIPLEINTEDERVKLIRNVAQVMALKANIKLNTKRLYQADGFAVKELLKITSLLYEALNINIDEKENDDEDSDFSLRDYDISDKINELKLSRQLATEITSAGATLFDLLGKEIELRPVRQKCVGRQFELNDVESGIKKAIEAVKEEIVETKQLIDNVSATEANLDAKIERRKTEIDRYEKRLQTLKKVRPAFLEEFQALETELEQLFVQYSTRLRCLNHLEMLFSETERAQLEKQIAMASQKVVEVIPLEGGDHNDMLINFDDDNNNSNDHRTGAINRQERPRASTGARHRQERSNRGSDSKHPRKTSSPISLDLSSDTDSDDLFIDKDEPELAQSDEDSLSMELSAAERVDRRAPSTRITSSKVQSNSDDDF